MVVIHPGVSRRWRRVLNEIHMATLDLRFAKSMVGVTVGDTLLGLVVGRYSGVRSLRLSGCIRITSAGEARCRLYVHAFGCSPFTIYMT